jgi:hypothetical protein
MVVEKQVNIPAYKTQLRMDELETAAYVARAVNYTRKFSYNFGPRSSRRSAMDPARLMKKDKVRSIELTHLLSR